MTSIVGEKMNPEVKALWVAALRSGEYIQGKHALQRYGEFCCFGVLCDLAVKNGVEVEVTHDQCAFVRYDGDTALPPPSVNKWAGVRAQTLRVRTDGTPSRISLTYANDARALSFNQIADLIEAQL